MTGIEPFGTSPWYWDFYTYWMEMRGNPAPDTYWGNSFIHDPSFTVPKGQWICVEVMMKMNNPTTERNGELALWVDGKPWFMGGQLVSHLGQGFPEGYYIWNWYPEIGCAECAPFEGFRWRSTEDLNLNWVWLLVYITSAPNGHISKVWFDDIVVAKEYIGPINQADYNADSKVTFADYAVLALRWEDQTCDEPTWCDSIDFDKSGSVDADDLAQFFESWLVGTE